MAGFTYPFRWHALTEELTGLLRGEADESVRHDPNAVAQRALALLEDRDRALEDYLNTLVTGGKRYATIVVAASDSLHKAAVDADFVCTGTADQTTINTALATLPAAGGRLVLMEGNYNLTGSISSSKALMVDGMDRNACFVNAYSQSTPVFDATSYLQLRNVQVDAATTAGCHGARCASDSVIDHCSFAGCDRAVTVIGGYEHWITDNIFYAPVTAVEFSSGARDSVIANNFVEGLANSTGDAIKVASEFCHIIANRLGIDGRGGDGILVSGAYNTVALNKIRGTKKHGIEVSGNEAIVSDNYVEDPDGTSTYDGIILSGTATNVNVRDNVVRKISNNFRYGLNVSVAGVTNCVTINNDLKGSGATGSYNDAGTGTVKNLDGSANLWNRI